MLALRALVVALLICAVASADAVPFAENGGLKMLYDNRMYPQAVELDGSLYLVWRGSEGFPYTRSYDLATRKFSDPVMILDGLEDTVNKKRYAADHHFAPVIWKDLKNHLHVLFGWHGANGMHMVSENPSDITAWRQGPNVADILSYPKIHQVFDNQTLIYFRYMAHLGFWTYRISGDDGDTWRGPVDGLIDMNAPPQTGFMAAHAGSYQTTRVSEDGKTLHVGFIWKVEDPIPSFRYSKVLHHHVRRHNLYYLKVDLPTGKVYNYEGRQLPVPVNKEVADRDCLVWDTRGRVAAVGPTIHLDDGEPSFVLPVSDRTPLESKFYYVRRQGDKWARTAIARTPHPFNSCHLDRDPDGTLQAYLITGLGESVPEPGMNFYGWGHKVERWFSTDNGASWKHGADLTPKLGRKYQNIQFVAKGLREISKDIFLFYGWDTNDGTGTGYLWDGR